MGGWIAGLLACLALGCHLAAPYTPQPAGARDAAPLETGTNAMSRDGGSIDDVSPNDVSTNDVSTNDVSTNDFGDTAEAGPCTPGSQVIEQDGIVDVPPACALITIRAWGGGGAGGFANYPYGGNEGGVGGYVEQQLSLGSGAQLTVVIGAGGVGGHHLVLSSTPCPGKAGLQRAEQSEAVLG